MTRFARLALGVAAATSLLAVATGAAGRTSSFGAYEIEIGAGGAVPSPIRARAFNSLPFWMNRDAVAHTVTFLDGGCTFTVEPGGRGWCVGQAFPIYAGSYVYRVGDSDQIYAEIVIVRNERTVSMAASKKTVRAGRPVTLSGTVLAEATADPGHGFPQVVTLLRREEGSRRFIPVRRIRSDIEGAPAPGPSGRLLPRSAWRITVRPRSTATFVARAADDRVWDPAESRRATIHVATR